MLGALLLLIVVPFALMLWLAWALVVAVLTIPVALVAAGLFGRAAAVMVLSGALYVALEAPVELADGASWWAWR